MQQVCDHTFRHSTDGASIYFMQREKNVGAVMRTLSDSGWTFQNLIVWKKKTSAIPGRFRYGKAFQVIVFASKGRKPRVFNRLRIDPELPLGYTPRKNGMFLTDVWDDIRELTAGYFSGSEPLRLENGERSHLQQSPIALLLRIVLSSSMPGDFVFDPFAGTGTTVCVARQLSRFGIGIEIDGVHVDSINERLTNPRKADDVEQYKSDYRLTTKLDSIWPTRSRSAS